MVWASLVGAMTLGGGLLLALEDEPGSAPAFAAVSGQARQSDSINEIFTRPAFIDRERWEGIVVHHSGDLSGSAQTLDERHRAGGLNGLGYHFVIGNGHGAKDGSIHVSARWLGQLPGAHTSGPNADYYNNRTIGICLIGDGERRRFTKAQMQALDELVGALRRELDIDAADVVLHRDVAPTSSPGRLFPRAAFRRELLRAP